MGGQWRRNPEQKALFTSWAKRMPSESHHDAAVWDDLLCGSQRMIHVLREGLQRSLQGHAEGAERDALLLDFDQARVSIAALHS